MDALTSATAESGAWQLVVTCGAVVASEAALVVADAATEPAARLVLAALDERGAASRLLVTDGPAMHGLEPLPDVAAAMLQSDVVFGMTTASMAHSNARNQATRAGARYLSLPGYSIEALASPALQADFRGITPAADALAGALSDAAVIVVESAAGTDLRASAAGRTGNSAPGWCDGPGSLASPPDAEANVAVLETSAEGRIVADGSVTAPGLGLLRAPIVLDVEAGRVTRCAGELAPMLEALLRAPADGAASTVAEIGLGLNPLARLSGWMLEDEGCLGTVHVGVGANATIGGRNEVPFHVDLVLRGATVTADGVLLEPALLLGGLP